MCATHSASGNGMQSVSFYTSSRELCTLPEGVREHCLENAFGVRRGDGLTPRPFSLFPGTFPEISHWDQALWGRGRRLWSRGRGRALLAEGQRGAMQGPSAFRPLLAAVRRRGGAMPGKVRVGRRGRAGPGRCRC